MAAWYISDENVAALPGAAMTQSYWYAYINAQNPLASPSYANNPTLTGAWTYDQEIPSGGVGAGTYPPTSMLAGTYATIADQLYDFRFRFWVVPTALNLSNPTLGANIPFYIWNSFPETGTVTAVNITGSSVLSFDYGATNSILDSQYLEVNMQIASGEPTIDATIDFVHGSLGIATIAVTAIVAETLPILPEIPVNEVWRFRTDVLTNYLGGESRLSIMLDPRVDVDFDVRVVDYEERRILYGLSASNIKVQSSIPFYQYSAPITAVTSIGGNRMYFDPGLCNARVGRTLIIMNRATLSTQLGSVTALHADGATISSAVGEEVSPGLWFAIPAMSMFLRDDSGLDFGTQAGTYKLSANSIETWSLQRPSASVSINLFDSLPLVEKPFLITTPERFAYRRELMGGTTVGAQQIRSRDTYAVVKRSVKFSVDRTTDEMDYWREFFALIRGAQKPFLLSTQLPDLTLRVAHADGASTLDINETYYEAKLYPLDSFKRVWIAYTDGTSSQHVISNSTTDASSNTQLSITPALTLTKTVSRISFLMKMRASDTVKLEHYNDYSYVKFGCRSTNT
jgi:hypothetical protein